MKPKHQRLVFVALSMVFLVAAVLLTMQAFKQNIVYFYSPSDLKSATHATPADTTIRIGGLVKAGSVAKTDGGEVSFTVTDGKNDLSVYYTGMLPSLFREGQGVIAEGKMRDGRMQAQSILAKHDENYMPKEVVDALKKSGHWEEQYGK